LAVAERGDVWAAQADLYGAANHDHVAAWNETRKSVPQEQNSMGNIASTRSASQKSRTTEPILMDTAELAAMLNMSESWVYREAAKLGLRGYKLGRGRNAKVQYKRSDVFKWLEQQKIH
jgi:predicted DNA-binding transcriptional regulator AlpA